MTKERRLGRGLEALLGRPFESAEPAASAPLAIHQPDVAPADGSVLQVNVYDVDANPFQPRREFDAEEIAALSQSIAEHGLLQPVVVRKVGQRFQLISGERRLRAAIKAGWAEVPVMVREADDRQVAELAIVENLQRKDLNALEKAASFQQYLERYRCTQEELASRLHIDRSTVANLIRLLELPASVQDAVRRSAITPGHARALLPLGDEREQILFCTRIQNESLSVRATEELVQEMIHAHDREETGANLDRPTLSISGGGSPRSAKPARSRQIAALEQQFRSWLGTKVDIRQGAKGKGKIVLHFNSAEEFDRLREYLQADQGEEREAG